RKAARMAELFSTWKEDPVATAALCWERDVRHGRERGPSLGPELYHEVRYEALVNYPPKVTMELCSFLGVDYEPSMLEFHQRYTLRGPGLSAKKASMPITPGLRDWRTQMPPSDVERFEAAAGDLLDELGYPRAVPRPGAAALERAAEIRDVFVRD